MSDDTNGVEDRSKPPPKAKLKQLSNGNWYWSIGVADGERTTEIEAVTAAWFYRDRQNLVPQKVRSNDRQQRFLETKWAPKDPFLPGATERLGNDCDKWDRAMTKEAKPTCPVCNDTGKAKSLLHGWDIDCQKCKSA